MFNYKWKVHYFYENYGIFCISLFAIYNFNVNEFFEWFYVFMKHKLSFKMLYFQGMK